MRTVSMVHVCILVRIFEIGTRSFPTESVHPMLFRRLLSYKSSLCDALMRPSAGRALTFADSERICRIEDLDPPVSYTHLTLPTILRV